MARDQRGRPLSSQRLLSLRLLLPSLAFASPNPTQKFASSSTPSRKPTYLLDSILL